MMKILPIFAIYMLDASSAVGVDPKPDKNVDQFLPANSETTFYGNYAGYLSLHLPGDNMPRGLPGGAGRWPMRYPNFPKRF